jgi:hypothetical protein
VSALPSQKGLLQAVEEIKARNGARPWPETLDICQFDLDLPDVHDDIKREVCWPALWRRLAMHLGA